jgi:hypothetical protein
MLPAQMQTTITLVAGMLMNFVDGDPVGEGCIALLIILTFIPILLFGVYLLWNPDYDVAAVLSGDLVAKILGPFLDRAEKVADTAMAKAEKGATQLLVQAEKGASKAHALGSQANEMGAGQARAEVITEAKEMKANAKKAKLKAVQLAIQVRQKRHSTGMPFCGVAWHLSKDAFPPITACNSTSRSHCVQLVRS